VYVGNYIYVLSVNAAIKKIGGILYDGKYIYRKIREYSVVDRVGSWRAYGDWSMVAKIQLDQSTHYRFLRSGMLYKPHH